MSRRSASASDHARPPREVEFVLFIVHGVPDHPVNPLYRSFKISWTNGTSSVRRTYLSRSTLVPRVSECLMDILE